MYGLLQLVLLFIKLVGQIKLNYLHMLIICCHTTANLAAQHHGAKCGTVALWGSVVDFCELALVGRILQRHTNGLTTVAERRPAFVLSHEERRHGATLWSPFISPRPGIYGVSFVLISEFTVIVSFLERLNNELLKTFKDYERTRKSLRGKFQKELQDPS